ncbi:MAG TPA: hypothetical protein VN517_09010 [Terriglobales bacterium]|nr:hypothetical protein [Terriglobales bacterium]
MPDPDQQNQQKPTLKQLVEDYQVRLDSLRDARAEIVHHYPESTQAQHIVYHHPEQFPEHYQALQKGRVEQDNQRVNGMEWSL